MPMTPPSPPPRRTLFRVWVIAPVLILIVLLAAAPFVETGRSGFGLMLYPPVLAVLVFAGLAWLVWFVFLRQRR